MTPSLVLNDLDDLAPASAPAPGKGKLMAMGDPRDAGHDEGLIDAFAQFVLLLDADGAVIRANRAWRKSMAVCGEPDDGWLGVSFALLVDRWSDDAIAERKHVIHAIREIIADRPIAETQLSVRRGNDEYEIRPQRLAPGGALLVIENVSERRAASRLRERFEKMIDASTDATLMIDAAGRVIYANDAARRIAGAQRGDDAPLTDVVDHAALAIAASDGVWRGEVALHTRDGADIPVVQVVQRHVSTGAADQPYFTVVLHDISAEKAREEELQNRHVELQLAYSRLKSTQDQLLQSEKMASIGQLAAGVAHEINNPIGYVHSNLGTLQDYIRQLFAMLAGQEAALRDTALPEPQRVELDEMRRRLEIDYLLQDLPNLVAESREGIERVRKIVQDLKDFSHVGAGEEWEIVDLHRGLDSTINIVWNEIKYKADVVKDYGSVPAVECLVSQVNQVFLNLLVNAAQAIPERGTIRVSTGAGDDHAWIAVTDSGNGIDAKHLPRIFDPFFTTKPVGQGTGLGLSLSYSIVSKHHGRIEVDSKPGEGTTFKIVLPFRQPPPRGT